MTYRLSHHILSFSHAFIGLIQTSRKVNDPQEALCIPYPLKNIQIFNPIGVLRVQDYCLTGKNHLSLSDRQMDLKGVIQQD
jgi:hypothetical protein